MISRPLQNYIGTGGKTMDTSGGFPAARYNDNDETSSYDEALELDGDAEYSINSPPAPAVMSRTLEYEYTTPLPPLPRSRYDLCKSFSAESIVWDDEYSQQPEPTSTVSAPPTGYSSVKNYKYGPGPRRIGQDHEETHETSSELENRVALGEPPQVQNSKSDIGQITRMDKGFPYGYIDGVYRFYKSDFMINGHFPFHCYDMVQYSAVERYDSEAMSLEWVVEDMKPYVRPELEQIYENRKFKIRTLQVKQINDSDVICQDAKVVEVIPKSKLPAAVEVCVGDWLSVRSEDVIVQGSSGNDVGHILSAGFLRKFVRQGVVTRWYPKYAVVDQEIIIISKNHCQYGRLPYQGKRVQVEYIESDQTWGGGFSHRAISVSRCQEPGHLDFIEEDREYPKKALEKLIEDKRGILLFVSKNCGRPSVEKDYCITVTNTSNKTCYLRNVRIGNEQSSCRFSVKVNRECLDFIHALEPGHVFQFKISCKPLQLGWTSDFCILEFCNFKIARELRVHCVPENSEIFSEITKTRASENVIRQTKASEAVAFQKKLEPFESTERSQVQGILCLRRPFFLPKMEDNPSSYKLPAFIIQACQQNSANLLYEHCPTLRPRHGTETSRLNLTYENYKEMLHVALWLEEYYHLKQKQKFSLEDVILERCGEFFTIPFPGVREVFPAFYSGDPIKLCDKYDARGSVINTAIQKMTENKIFVKMDEAFSKTYTGKPMSVQFRIGRTKYRRSHFAVDIAVVTFGVNWLFPSEPLLLREPRIIFFDDKDNAVTPVVPVPPAETLYRLHYPVRPLLKRGEGVDKRRKSFRERPPKVEEVDVKDEFEVTQEVQLQWYNPVLNLEQREAVKRILRGDTRPLPYIVFGPPGTGKTVTVVEAVTQINRIDKNSRILVTAPSNAAVDLICTYLIEIAKYGTGEFVRLVGFNRVDNGNVPDLTRPYCQTGDNIEAICKYRIIVCTCNSAGQFFQMDPKLSVLHISHVFIDEAGYCSEPDSLIPCLFVCNNHKAQVILAGDPKQLGPTVFDDSAAAYSLEGSLMERLMKNPLYQRDRTTKLYNPTLVTKLVRNYRAHPSLLEFPSKRFYDNELIASASGVVTGLCNLPFLPKEGIPMIFHGVRGEQAKDSDSPSWYNPDEVMEVLDYLKKLLHEGCLTEDIGIITPYRKQVEKIRIAISMELGCVIPKVGSVEEFQGGEKNIIILSLVRSADADEESESLEKFEFVFSQRRFNVSATRAKSLFITIGNPRLFALNPTWKEFIKHCIKKGVYIGCDLPVFLRPYYLKYSPKKDGEEDADDWMCDEDRASEDSEEDNENDWYRI